MREKVDKVNREIKVENNEHSGTKTGASYTGEQKDDELEINYSKNHLKTNEKNYHFSII